MEFGIVLRTLGLLLLVEATTMLPSLGLAVYYGEGYQPFLYSILIILAIGGMIAAMTGKKKPGMIRYREGFMIVGLGWVLFSVFGALPFVLSGAIPSFIDAVFETTSGFTTTGATILTNIEILPRSILFWRSFTHWLGGMGILVFTLALLPALGMGTVQVFKAESPGPSPGKLVPRIGQTAKLLYIIYFAISLAEVILLAIAGMSIFDAFTHTFATMGTGGFSTLNASIAGFENPTIEWIIIVFMILAGTNFALFYGIFNKKFFSIFKDSEFKFYMLVAGTASILVIFNTLPYYGGLAAQGIRDSIFQVASIVTTTGFTTVDYEVWPTLSKMLLFLLMFFGGSAGSTGGAIKQIRILLVLKYVNREISRLIHPRAVIPIRVGGKTVPDSVMQNVVGFVLLYMLLFCLFSVILTTQGMDLISSTAAVAATIGNIGPGLGLVGPAQNYAALTDLTKIILTLSMLLGRLEIYTILILFMPSFWKK
jgi:trk system potassium uptake protein